MSGTEREAKKILRHCLILLDHLQRRADSRLEAQFDEMRAKLGVTAARTAVPPCTSYHVFLGRLSQIDSALREGKATSNSVEPDPKDPKLDDISFLRWSRDFLAAVAAPVTVESIEITRRYMEERATRGLWGILSSKKFVRYLFRVKSPIDKEPSVPSDPDDGDEINFIKSALWLARSVRRLEYGTLFAASIAVLLSAYAMVGRSIITDRNQDLDRLRAANGAIENAAIPHLGAGRLYMGESIALQVCSPSSNSPKHHDIRLRIPEIGPSDAILEAEDPARGVSPPAPVVVPAMSGDGRSNAKPSGDLQQSGIYAALGKVHDGTSPALIQTLAAQCNQWRWALMQLVSENVRLKSWDQPFIAGLMPVQYLIGWNQTSIAEYGSTIRTDFCDIVERSYLQDEPRPDDDFLYPELTDMGSCPTVFKSLVVDSSSTASSILAVITQAVLPILYAFIGAAMATLFAIGRKIDSAILSYTDRALPRSNAVLGIVFGAIIGLFASYLNQNPAVGGLQLSALALLAGLNVPGVFAFFTELSGRIFGTTT